MDTRPSRTRRGAALTPDTPRCRAGLGARAASGRAGPDPAGAVGKYKSPRRDRRILLYTT